MKEFRNFFTAGGSAAVRQIRYTQKACGTDGFVIHIDADGNCEIAYTNARGRRYAMRAIERRRENAFVGRAEDHADFEWRGIVEGYYGKPYSAQERKDLLDFMDEMRMNIYLYAPKNDPYHREKWREPYPEKEREELRELCAYAADLAVDMCYCISPGLDMRYSDPHDVETLIEKIETLQTLGFGKIALLFDDIKAELLPEDATKYVSAAQAQADVAIAVQNAVGQRILFCPTDYWQNTDTPYRADLRKYLPSDAAVLWTGYNTVAEYIDAADATDAARWFGRELWLWDNYPVNDFMPERLFLGALRNRDTNLSAYHKGMLLNPMEYPSLSKFALFTTARYMWNASVYDPDEAEEEAAAMLAPQAPAQALRLVRDNAACVMYTPQTPCDPAARQRDYRVLQKALPAAMLRELQPYFAYAETEYKAYRQLLRGKDITPLLKKLHASAVRTAYNAFDAEMERHPHYAYIPKKTRECYRCI
ncbi:MAG: beta-N-acetylglucosaminidase domain-containing protein [Clostridiales bacterium]|nr:beta-N-acetylglucosaminidase domain-containing protein [Clostridiales bacterium]